MTGNLNTDGRILGLIHSWLTAGVMTDGNLTYQTTGTPQGGVPPNKAKTALGLLKQMAEGELRLTLHPEKTRLTTCGQGFDFLGFTFKGQHRVARKLPWRSSRTE